MDGDRSYIESIKSYPLNVEARHVKTYAAKAPPSNQSMGSISIEINNSMILLPEEPMKRRYFDERVGWFARGQVDYGLEAQESKTLRYLDRWRLEVKDEDLGRPQETGPGSESTGPEGTISRETQPSLGGPSLVPSSSSLWGSGSGVALRGPRVRTNRVSKVLS